MPTPRSMPGSRPYFAGIALMVFFAGGHAAGVLVTVLHERDVPGLHEQFEAMRGFGVPGVAGMDTTLWGLRQFFNVAFSVLLVGGALAGAVAGRFARVLARADLLRACAAVLCVQMGALAALGLWFGVAQAVVTAGACAVCFGVGAARAK